MKKGKIFFRVDGNEQIGLGHLVRCVALAQMLKSTFEILFFCKSIPSQVTEELKLNDFEVSQIKNESSFFAKINSDSIIVLDGYQFDIEYQKQIKAAGCKLVCIDDLHDKEFVADLIINHAPGVLPGDYKARSYTQFALGLNYVLLRPLFLQQAKKTQRNLGTDVVLICFGGSDPENLTKRTLEVVLNSNVFKKVIVVTGAAYIFGESLAILTNLNPVVEHYSAIGEAGMLALMLQADLAIVPSSGILFETMASGCKIISGYYADNQKILYERLKNAGAFIAAGNFASYDIENAITEAVKPGKPVPKLINGQSDKNILQSFYYMLTSLREADYSDCEQIFYWANDPKVRINAFNTNSIKFEDHKTWFDKKIKAKSCYIFILTFLGTDAGQIRFDIVDHVATISYLIDENYRGLGLGSLIVKKGIDIMKAENKKYTLSALVKPLNEASIKVFQRLGFHQDIIKYEEFDNIYSFSLEL